VVGKPTGGQIHPSAQSKCSKGIRNNAGFPFFVKMAKVAEKWLADGPTLISVAGNELVRYIRVSIRGHKKVMEELIGKP